MMKQYFSIKEKNKDSIVFFRLGDFYEMFFDDAITASRELELTLTGRDCGQEKRAPMCGVPFHSSESYIAKLVSKGYKVAICEQTEDASLAKGLVRREIIRVITPGTVLESSMLEEGKNNYIASIYAENDRIGLCFCDISTGQLCAALLHGKDAVLSLKNHLTGFQPREILVGGDVVKIKELPLFIREKLSCGIEMLEDKDFSYELCEASVKDQFSIIRFDLKEKSQMTCSLGALLNYLRGTQRTGLERIRNIEFLDENQFMQFDYSTHKNLELTETMRGKEKKGSLLWVLDKTKTAMGKRLIRSYLERPLRNTFAIDKRHNAVEELVSDTVMRLELTDCLSGVFDMERLLTKIVYGSASARDLRALLSAIKKLPQLSGLIKHTKSNLLSEVYGSLDTLEDIYQVIEEAIVEEPPFSVREGGMIRKGYNKELDELNNIMSDSASVLAQIEADERKNTGIPKLKISYNRVFGYFIEVSNSFKDKVPDSYIRKQTLSNCERYITPALKKLESEIIGAKDKAMALEYALFSQICKKVSANLDRIQKTAQAVAGLDVLCSFAGISADNGYVRPLINSSGIISIKESRHPVVEALLKNAPFVPNDILLDCGSNRVNIITGPNMAGKSTYMRTAALIVIMAQIGCFVPAKSAEIGVVDAVFTRVGASDDLASGQSTFMVEMSEVAYIVKNATARSLLIFDEIGRGTSTFDGMSIARAVIEFVADKKKLGAKAMFATHYHELTVLEALMEGIKNYNIAVKKRGDEISFLRRIVPGGADDSFGIEVAKLAGVPNWIIARAKEVLKELESGELGAAIKKKEVKVVRDEKEDGQFSLFAIENSPVHEKLKSIDVNVLTPIEAMNLLFELKKMV